VDMFYFLCMMKKNAYALILMLAVAFTAFGDNAADTLGVDADTAVDNVVHNAAGKSAPAASAIRKAVVIPVKGTVDHGMAAFIGRAIHDASKHENTLIVLDIDTYGGQVDAAFTIVDSILGAKAPTVAFVRSKAISAGALIALSANQLFMRPGTTIGDVAPLINTNEGPQMLGEKHQSPIRAKFRTLAHKNGYPEVLTEAMVTEEIAVYEVTLPDTVIYLDSLRIVNLDPAVKKQIKSQKKVVRAGELLTMTEVEAHRYGFSRKTVNTINEMLQAMGHTEAAIVPIGKNWSENLVSLLATLAPVLMMFGFALIYIEMRTPGFGVPGIIGILCIALVFFGQYMVGLANHVELLLIVAGVLLLCLEVFVLPGFFIGAIGLFMMIIGMALSFQSFVIPSPDLPWQTEALKRNILRFSLTIIGSLTLIIIFFKYFFERLGLVVKGPYLAATLGGAQADEDMVFVPKLGDRGTALTPLRPAGKVKIGKEMCDVVTDGQFINNGTEVVVTQIQGNRIVVAAE